MKKRASRRLSQAGAHSAEAMWVLPVPTSPISTRSSRRPGNDSDSSPSRPSPSGHLALLAVNKGDILTRDQLTIQIWGEAYAGETLGVAVYIRRIREKIEDNPSKPRYVQTVWREGYRFGD